MYIDLVRLELFRTITPHYSLPATCRLAVALSAEILVAWQSLSAIQKVSKALSVWIMSFVIRESFVATKDPRKRGNNRNDHMSLWHSRPGTMRHLKLMGRTIVIKFQQCFVPRDQSTAILIVSERTIFSSSSILNNTLGSNWSRHTYNADKGATCAPTIAT